MSVITELLSGVGGGIFSGIGSLAKDLRTAITGIDPAKAAELQQIVSQLELETQKAQSAMIVAEASSADPWTSRARPSFLYVVYLLILWALPMGLASIWYPEAVGTFTAGFKAWLESIPEPMLQLFGVVMTGYVAGRSWEKVKGATK
jgi:hypothetical protein